jgi:hypothetical protein
VLVATLHVRAAPTTDSEIVASYSQGETFNYDNFTVQNGYVWLSYIGGSGIRRFVAEGPDDGNSSDVYVSGGVS